MKQKMMVLMGCFLMAGCASQIDNQQSKVLDSLGDIYAEDNRFSEAEEYYQRAYMNQPNNISLMLKLADVLVQEGKLSQAIQLYEKILEKDPYNEKARYRLARVQMASGHLSAALNGYIILLKTNKKNVQSLNGLGVLLDHVGYSVKAQSCYKTGLKYAPKDFSLLNNLGMSYALSGHLKQATFYLQKSSEALKTTRPLNNIKLISRYYRDMPDPMQRQKALRQILLIKAKSTNPSLVSQTLGAAET